jgi:hypothetical protein
VDLRIAGEESWQQLLARHEARGELERRETQGGLEDQVVDRHERDLRSTIARIGEEAFMGCDELVVEDRLECWRDLLAGAPDMRGDRGGL